MSRVLGAAWAAGGAQAQQPQAQQHLLASACVGLFSTTSGAQQQQLLALGASGGVLRGGGAERWASVAWAPRAEGLPLLPFAARSLATKASPKNKKKPSNTGGRPKAGVTSFSFFVREQFEAVRSSLPPGPDGKPAKPTLVLPEVAKRWAALGEADKKKYQELAAGDAQTRARAEYKERQGAASVSGYRLFVKEALPQYLERTPLQTERTAQEAALKRSQAAISLTAEGWKALTPEQRAVYNDKAAQLRAAVKPKP